MERSDLQRLLRSKLDVIAPDCKLIAEEFCSWDDSKRRIDLLAVDKDANLVVIELKRTDDAGHIELQALRYAAMISTMSFEQAVEAHTAYLQKTGGTDDARRAIDIRCVRLRPHRFAGETLVDVQPLIPSKWCAV